MYILWLKYTDWLKFHPDSTVLTTNWPLVTSERSWYRHFRNQQKKCYRLICILPRLKCVFIKIPISVDIGSFDVDLTPKRSKFDQTKGRNEILITFSYNIRVQNGDSLWVIFQALALMMARNVTRAFLRGTWKYFFVTEVQVVDRTTFAQKILNLCHYQLGQGHFFLSDLTLFILNFLKASDDNIIMIYSSKKLFNQIVVSIYLILNSSQCQLIQLSLYESNCIILFVFQQHLFTGSKSVLDHNLCQSHGLQ